MQDAQIRHRRVEAGWCIATICTTSWHWWLAIAGQEAVRGLGVMRAGGHSSDAAPLPRVEPQNAVLHTSIMCTRYVQYEQQ